MKGRSTSPFLPRRSGGRKPIIFQGVTAQVRNSRMNHYCLPNILIMEDFEKEKLSLKRVLEDAFKNIVFPGDDKLLAPDSFDDNDIVDFKQDTFWKTDWRLIPEEVIDLNHQSLPFFSPEAYRFYLPAYLRRAIDTLFVADINVLEFTLYNLVPDKTSSRILKRFERRKQALDDRQKQVVIRFLEFVKKWCDDDTLSRVADEGLKEYWR